MSDEFGLCKLTSVNSFTASLHTSQSVALAPHSTLWASQ